MSTSRLDVRAVPAVLVLLLAAACGTDQPTERPRPRPDSTSCATPAHAGDILVAQGHPTDLPGGGSTGIGQVEQGAHPTHVRLVLGDARPGETATDLSVGSEFTVQGVGYRVTCVGTSTVTLRPTVALPACPASSVQLPADVPVDLPGGGSAVLDSVDLTARTAVLRTGSGPTPQTATAPLRTGDRFRVAGGRYRVSCVSPRQVTLDWPAS